MTEENLVEAFERLHSPLLNPDRLAAVAATHLLDTGADEVFDRLARLAGTLLGTPYAFVTIVDDTRSFWKSCIGVESSVLAERQNPVEDSFCQYVVARGEPLIVPDARANPITRDNPSIAGMGVTAWAGFPLRSIDGHVLGTFCVVDTVVRAWSAEDVHILETFAFAAESQIRLRTLLEQAETSSAQLRAEMGMRERLAQLAAALAAADTADAVAAAIMAEGPSIFGASFAVVGVVLEGGRQFRMLMPDSITNDIAAKYRTVEVQATTPLSDAIRTGVEVWLPDREHHIPRYSDLLVDADTTGVVAVAAVPLRQANGSVVGGLGITWSKPNVFTDDMRAMIATVASMSAQALERAVLADTRNAFVLSLQRHLLPAIKPLPTLDVSGFYSPATKGLGFGGDWYDVVVLRDGRVAFIIGDVVGHGVEAAARMAQVRSSMHALVSAGADDLSTIFDDVESMLGVRESYVATAAIVLVDTQAGTAIHVSAGHPPMVLADADGATRVLEGGRRPVLGMGGRATAVPFEFLPGSMIVGYTDGLIEVRNEVIDVGIDRLCQLLRFDRIAPKGGEVRWVESGAKYAESIAVRLTEGRVRYDDLAVISVYRRTAETGHDA